MISHFDAIVGHSYSSCRFKDDSTGHRASVITIPTTNLYEIMRPQSQSLKGLSNTALLKIPVLLLIFRAASHFCELFLAHAGRDVCSVVYMRELLQRPFGEAM